MEFEMLWHVSNVVGCGFLIHRRGRMKMSLKSKITGTTKADKDFKEILQSVKPNSGDYYTLSGKRAFSDDYNLIVPNTLSNQYDASLVGMAFDYLARFRIAQILKIPDAVRGMAALDGFKRISNHEDILHVFESWFNEIVKFIKNKSMPVTGLFEISVHLAKLEQINRAGTKIENINTDYLLYEPASQEVIDDIGNLMMLFEKTFMNPIINKKSKVDFNPHFGVSSSLVGADADILIDGTLYDFKTTKEKSLKTNDNLQMIGYYLLNEFATYLDIEYDDIGIERVAFYKARFGEVEYYDVRKHLSYENLKPKLIELAKYFRENQRDLKWSMWSDIAALKERLKKMANGDIDW
jgi:hypothetical protein